MPTLERLGPWIRHERAQVLDLGRSRGGFLEHLVDAWTDGTYAVMLSSPPQLEGDHLMITQAVREIECTWSTLQAIKNDLVPNGHRRWAVEMYPPHRAVVNDAPMRHLHVLPAGGEPGLMDLRDFGS